MHGKISEILSSIEALTLQLNGFKPASEAELDKVRGEVSAEVGKKLSANEEQIAKLNEELNIQSKVATNTSSTLQDLMVSIENLGDDII